MQRKETMFNINRQYTVVVVHSKLKYTPGQISAPLGSKTSIQFFPVSGTIPLGWSVYFLCFFFFKDLPVHSKDKSSFRKAL